MFQQLRYFIQDYRRATGKYWFRGIYIWLSWGIIGIFFYRIERGLYILLRKWYKYIRVPLLPLLYIIQSLSHLDINYHADIKGGLTVLHYSLGIVISGKAIIGHNLTLVGGNVIGVKTGLSNGEYLIGDNCVFGANAVSIGPLAIGNNVSVGASSCVIKDVPSGIIVAGVPAKILHVF